MKPYEDDDVREIAQAYDLDNDDAMEVRDLRDELDVDDDEAFEIWEAM